MNYRRGVDAATSAPLLQAGGNGQLTEMHHSSHPPPRRKPGFFASLFRITVQPTRRIGPQIPSGMAANTDTLLKALQWRYATKTFDPNLPIEPATWEALEESLLLTASSYGLQPWRFLVITNAAIRAELRPHSWNQSQITDCSHLVVLLKKRTVTAADADRLIEAIAATRGIDASTLAGYRQMIQVDLIDGPRSQIIGQWASNQVYIALGNLLTSAALLGVDTCAIEGFSPPDYDRILGLENGDYQSCVVCACGHRSSSDNYANLAKVRYSATDLIEHR
jgi:nitroreductase